jgi:hypothetical protein
LVIRPTAAKIREVLGFEEQHNWRKYVKRGVNSAVTGVFSPCRAVGQKTDSQKNDKTMNCIKIQIKEQILFCCGEIRVKLLT